MKTPIAMFILLMAINSQAIIANPLLDDGGLVMPIITLHVNDDAPDEITFSTLTAESETVFPLVITLWNSEEQKVYESTIYEQGENVYISGLSAGYIPTPRHKSRWHLGGSNHPR